MSDGWRGDPAWPDVDIVMPIRNEARHLPAAVASVREQDYPGNARVIISVGPSDDDTMEVAASSTSGDPAVAVVVNPTGRTAAALNIAIRAGHAPIVVRVDGRSVLSPGYVRRAVETMRRTGAVNVGGRQVPISTTPFERAVADATTSWLGTGGAAYRTGGGEREVDTVYLGVFDRAAIEDVGLFDERLIRNQDYELNIRLRRAGGTIWFDPELSADYVPRGSWKTLATQYFEYGLWKSRVMRLHPGATKLRQIAPLAVALANVGAVALSVRHRRALAIPAVYASALVVLTPARGSRHRLRTAAVIAVIHHAWPVGLILGFVRRFDRDSSAA